MRRIFFSVLNLLAVGALGTMLGCASGDTATTGTGGSSPKGSGGSGGSSSTGGTIGTGGTPSTGGTIGTGGTPATGGVTGTGGFVATGGVIGTGGTPGTGGVTGAGGTPSTGGTTGAAGTSGTGGTPSTGGTTGTGGTQTGGTTGTAGSGGFGQPICGSTGAGTAIAKSVACTATDPQLCYKTCGPASIGVKSETCTTGTYMEMSGCSFDPGMNYACYKIPTPLDAACPTTIPQAGQACAVDACVVCNVGGMYLDTSSAMKAGYCVCQASGKWTCAATNAWPCPGGMGC